MKIITGSTGTNHITSDDDRQFNSAVVGTGDYVLNLGNKFAATLVNNNLVQIADGDLCMQGCHARINANTTEDVTIDTGAIGAKRIDLLVARYELNNSTGFEDVQLVIVKGAEDASTPAVPAINDNTVLRNGATIHDMALYKITLDGINVDSVEPMFTVMEKSLSALDTEIDEINSNLLELKSKVNSFSSEEKVIGTWLDGSPLYAKTYDYTFAPLINQVDTNDIDTNLVGKTVNLTGVVAEEDTGSRRVFGLNYFEDANFFNGVYVTGNDTTLRIRYKRFNAGTNLNYRVLVTRMYTK